MSRALGFALLALVASSCAVSRHQASPLPAGDAPRAAAAIESRPAAVEPSGHTAGVLARVGGAPITSDDVVHGLFHGTADERETVNAALDHLIMRVIVDREAERNHIVVPATAAATADTRESWLIPRLVRLDGLTTDRVEIQILVVRDEALARELDQKLADGADFGVLAMQHSLHDSRTTGGRLPAVAVDSLAPLVAERVATLAPGGRTGLLAPGGGAGPGQFEIVRLLRRLPGRPRTWSEAAAEVEADLATSPITELEYRAWKVRAERLYNLKIDDSL